MKLINFILLGSMMLSSISCDSKEDEDEIFEKKTTSSSSNYLVFGYFYGMCIGESCIETFKLTDTQLFEDTKDDYSEVDFNFIELGNDKFDQVKDLAGIFPNQLLMDNSSNIGCPDCADGGGIFIQYAHNGKIQSWRVDQDKSKIPNYLHDFVDKINEKIALINN